jgi:hypothetical protein
MSTYIKLYLLSLNYSVNIGFIVGGLYSCNDKKKSTNEKLLHHCKYIMLGGFVGSIYPISILYMPYFLNKK